MEVVLRSNRGSTTFANISKEEQQLLEHFLKSKNLRVKNEDRDVQERLQTALGSDSDEEDINMGSAGEDDESVDEDFQASSDNDGEEVAEEFDSDAVLSDADEGSDNDEERPSKKPKVE